MSSGRISPAEPYHPDEDDISVALLSNDLAGSVTGPVGHGGLRLSVQQREFARQYVLSGGNATKAAVMAGYTWPVKAGFRNILNPAILHEIKRLSIVHTEALLPLAIRQLVEIMCNPEIDGKARVSAAVALLDRGGMRPKADPTTAVQVNVSINGSQAQAAIADVWKAREARLSGEMSDIGGGMSDTDAALIEHAVPPSLEAFEASAAGGRGGVVDQGPLPRQSSIPPPSPEHPTQTPEGAPDSSRMNPEGDEN